MPSAEDRFLEALPVIERAISYTCSRNGAFADDADEFAAHAKLKFVEDDYRILGAYQGKSALSTYVTTVTLNLFRDWRISRWGKWRPSASARRLGPVAVAFETLHFRDGFSIQESIETLRSRRIALEESDVERFVSDLPPRYGRRFVSDDALQARAGTVDTEEAAREAENAATGEHTRDALERSFEALSPEERFVLKAFFGEGLKLVDIARTMGVPQEAIYPMKNKALGRLRLALEAEGVTWDSVQGALASPSFDLRVGFIDGQDPEQQDQAE